MAAAGIILVAVILFLVTFKHIMDVFEFLKNPQQVVLQKYGQIITRVISETCQDLGLIGLQERLKGVRLIDESALDLPEWIDQYQERFMEIIKRELQRIPAEVGTQRKRHYRYYLDLRRTLTDPGKAAELGLVMIAFMRETIEKQRIAFDYIASHRSGSTILGYLLSAHFKRPLLLINTQSRWRLDRKDVFVDGIYATTGAESPPEVALVDDSCSGGGSLLEAASRLRDEGLTVRHAFVLFNRVEANAELRLAEAGIRLHAISQFSDKELSEIMSTTETSLPIVREVRSFANTRWAAKKEPNFFPYKLHRLNLYVTLACPLRCKHCCVGPMLNAAQMGRDEAIRYIRMAGFEGGPQELLILGGEPTIYRYLEDVVQEAAQYRNTKVSLCTSGINHERVLDLSKLLDHVNISLDGFSAETHDAVRRPGAYRTALRAIEALRTANLPVHVMFTANALNIKEVFDGLTDLSQRGVDVVNFHVISETGFAKQNKSLLLDPHEWYVMRQKLDTYEGPLTVRYPLKYVTEQELAEERKQNYECMLSDINRLNVLPGGRSYACCLFLDSDYPVGHVDVATNAFIKAEVSEESIYANDASGTCPAESILLGHELRDLIPVCVHWKRLRQPTKVQTEMS